MFVAAWGWPALASSSCWVAFSLAVLVAWGAPFWGAFVLTLFALRPALLAAWPFASVLSLNLSKRLRAGAAGDTGCISKAASSAGGAGWGADAGCFLGRPRFFAGSSCFCSRASFLSFLARPFSAEVSAVSWQGTRRKCILDPNKGDMFNFTAFSVFAFGQSRFPQLAGPTQV